MVIPACSRVALIWSSRILISSVISAGTLPDLSRPMRPARYSVLPVKMPPLNGACGLSSGRRIARRLGCAGAWENAPRTVSNPAAASTRNTKPALRFSADLLLLRIVSSVAPALGRRRRDKGASVFRAWLGCKRTNSRGSDVRPRGRFFRGYFALSCAGDLGDNLFGSRFADRAIAVVNAALRQSEIASASAALGVELVESDLPLLRSEPGKIHTGKLAGAIGVRKKNLTGIFKRFHSRIDGQAEQGADFRFIQGGVAQTFVLLHDAALRVQHKRRGQRGDASILEAHLRGGHGHRIVDVLIGDDLLDH